MTIPRENEFLKFPYNNLFLIITNLENMKKIIILLILLTTSNLFCSDYKEEWELIFHTYNKEFYDVSACDSLNLVAISYSFVISAPRLFKTTDAGVSWAQILPDSLLYLDSENKIGRINPKCVSYPTINTIIVGCDSGRYYRTTNAGINWQLLQANTFNLDIQRVDMLNDKTGFISSKFFLYRTDDSAFTWNIVELPVKETHRILFDFCVINENNYKIGVNVRDDSTRIISTTDAGINWNVLECGFRQPFKMSFVDSLNGWMKLYSPDLNTAYDEYDVILNTTDGGNSWEYQLNEKIEPPYGLRWIHFYNQMNGVAGGPKGKVLLTNDGGKNWRRSFLFENDTTTESRCGIMTGPSTSFIFTTEGLVYKLKPDANPVEEAFIQESEFSFFPNPIKAGSKLKVKNFIINGDSYSIKLYNSICNVVYENKLITSEILEGIQIPNNISNGLYFLTISGNGFVKTGKIIISDK